MRTHLFNSLLLLVISFFYFIFSIRDQDIHLLSFDQVGKRSEITFNEGKVLLAGEEVAFETTSMYKNLGIILVRFYNDNRDSDDQLIFTMSDKSTGKVLHQSKHNTDQFLPNRLFGFGIAPQDQSTGANYVFTLTSERGTSESGILISSKEPIFVLRSVLTKADVIANPSVAFQIIKNKVEVLFSSENTKISMLVATVPILFFLIGQIFTGSGFAYFFWTYLFFVYCLTKVPPQHLDYYLLSLVYFWYTIIRAKNTDLTYTLATSFLIFLFGQSDSSFALSLLLTATGLLFCDNSQKSNLKSFWREINDVSICENKPKLKFSLKIILTILSIVYLKMALDKIWPYFTVYKSLSLFPRNYPKEILILCGQTISVLGFIATLLLTKNKVKLPTLLIMISVSSLLLFRQISSVLYNSLTSPLKEVHLVNISPQLVSEAWVDVTITGKNFQDEPFRGQVLLGPDKTPQRIISWTNERILFRTNPELTKSGDICIVTRSKGGSNCLPFSYQFKQ